MAVKETIISKYLDNITSSADLLGSAKPSILFCPLASLLRGLVCGKGDRMLSGASMTLRRLIHPIIMLLVPAFMDYKQVFESKNALLGIDAPDKPLELPKESVIWCVNHGFKDDVAASIHSTRHSYVYFGSLPHFYNTFDGLALFLNGAILCNRKIRRLKQASYELAVRSLKKGNGQTTRAELLDGFETADDAWESYMAMHTDCQKYYDLEIELCADYRPKQIVRPEDVWQSVANIQNIHVENVGHVRYARALVEREKRRDFQRRF